MPRNALLYSSELAALGDLIATETEAACDLLCEHLETARQYLVGAMPAEDREVFGHPPRDRAIWIRLNGRRYGS